MVLELQIMAYGYGLRAYAQGYQYVYWAEITKSFRFEGLGYGVPCSSYILGPYEHPFSNGAANSKATEHLIIKPQPSKAAPWARPTRTLDPTAHRAVQQSGWILAVDAWSGCA